MVGEVGGWFYKLQFLFGVMLIDGDYERPALGSAGRFLDQRTIILVYFILLFLLIFVFIFVFFILALLFLLIIEHWPLWLMVFAHFGVTLGLETETLACGYVEIC